MSIATGKGDDGSTGLIGGQRVPKDDPRLEAYGTVDELNAAIGMARATELSPAIDRELGRISEWLFALGSDLATPHRGPDDKKVPLLPAGTALELEEWIHREEGELPPLRNFILPGGNAASAVFHLARTVCRRAERHVVSLHQATGEAAPAIVFLNRLSDLLFLYARRANHDAGISDVEWRPEKT